MKRFFLGMVVGFLAVSAFRGHSRANPPRPVPPPLHVRTVAYGPDRFVVVQHDQNAGFPPVRDGRESVQDIPVPIVPGTRVTKAKIQPPKPPGPAREKPRTVPDRGRRLQAPLSPRSDLRVITGRLSVTEERAQEDVRKKVDEAIAEWLAPEVVSSWQVPASLREGLVQKTEVRPVEKELDGEHVTLFEASQTVDFSHARRTALVEAYHRELVARRLAILAGVLAFILACLAALAGYIRADEATKGYYTNRLRLVSAAGVGAAGVLIYQLLV
ncbi:MAG: hypothetical protein P4L84_02130 [Isosphaeraceae bacterium]|nr:hypothetical protein [Isosphaeraceae bacterium]